MSSLFAISRAFRPPLPLLARSLSSLRSTRGTGPRRTIGRRPLPSGIPDNATNASKTLLRPPPPEPSQEPHVYNSLSTPVFIPEDPGAVVTTCHPAARILENSSLVVQRQLELGNILLGFEQANKYVIMDPAGNHVGFMAEEENSITKILMRQWARTHRSFLTHVFDKHGVEVLRFHRPFSFINSTITAYDPIDPHSPLGAPTHVPKDQHRIIGECQQQWHLLRRKYNLFLYHDSPADSSIPDHEPVAGGRDGTYTQFAYVDEPFLSWDFSLLTDDQPSRLIGSVNRNFAGFGREIFTDTGVYALRMDAASVAAEPPHLISNTHHGREYRVPPTTTPTQDLQGVGEPAAGRGMTLDERAIMLAAAVSIDFDYFSRHSSVGHGGFMPVGVFGGGSEHNPGAAAGGVGAGVGAGMMGGAMGGYGGGQQGEQIQGQEDGSPADLYQPQQQQQDPWGGYPADPPQQDPWGGYPADPYQQQQQPQQPQPPPEGGEGGGGFWFFDE